MREFITNTLLFVLLLAVIMIIVLAFLGPTELLTVEGWKKLFATGEIGEYRLDWKYLLRSGTFLGALIAGSIAGAIALMTGAVKNKLGMGFTGFLACIGAGLVGGLVIAIPVMGIFTWWICKAAEQDKRELEQSARIYQDG
jgi:hypothetical protein